MPVHVSIHDVTPAFERQVELALEIAHERGARPALLVVPDFHRRWPLSAHPAFCRRLRALQAAGHEVLLHGFFHAAEPGSPARSLAGRVRGAFFQKVVSAGEAEFGDLDPHEAERRLRDGERVLEDVGLAISGFVPPAWSMPKALLGTLAQRGYDYTEDHLMIHDPAARRARVTLLLNYASRSRLRLWSSVAYVRAVREARALLPVRIAIHPGDVDVRRLRRELTRLLDWARGDFVPRARDLFEHARVPSEVLR
jgi:uncharacterized protein